MIAPLSLESGARGSESSQSQQSIVFETGKPSGSGGGSEVSDVAA